jgi:anti-sigma regulatory factor (Ser/Thr protein kinase)
VTSEPQHNARVREIVERVAGEMGFGERDLCLIISAVDEALSNVIRHGYEGRPGQPIEITMERLTLATGVALQVRLCDCGKQVDPATIKGRDLEDLKPGGLGTHIIKTVMDEVEYTRREEGGMQIRMLKHLRPSG